MRSATVDYTRVPPEARRENFFSLDKDLSWKSRYGEVRLSTYFGGNPVLKKGK
jgi:hypothetical protein